MKVEDVNLADVNTNLDTTLQDLANLLKQTPQVLKKVHKRTYKKKDAKVSDVLSGEITPPQVSDFENFNPYVTKNFIEKLKPKTATPKKRSRDYETDVTQDSEFVTPKRKSLPLRDHTALIEKLKPKTATPKKRSRDYETDVTQDSEFVTPKRKSLPHRDRATKKEIEEKKTQELADYIKNNPNYGFTDSGQVVSPKSKKPVKGSNNKDIASYTISSVGKTTPPGFKKIRKLLQSDENVKKIKADPKGRFSVKNWS
uniref:Ribosome biogenesis protein NOP53 n=1 Tax=Panagrolaimus sp. PS1159 TaxID=55785 RepID=A0AC35GAG6_9BILA